MLGADVTYAAGEVIQATVTFSETVTGAPQLTLKVGAWTERRITSVAGNDLDTDGVSVEAIHISGILDDEGLSRRKAEGRTGVSHADFTRIRNVQLDRLTIDRLMTALNKLGQHVDVQIDVHPRVAAE